MRTPWAGRMALGLGVATGCGLALLIAASHAGGALARDHAGPAGPPRCNDARLQLTEDYRYAVGSASVSDPDGDPEGGSSYRWLVNGRPFDAGAVGEGLLLHLDGDLAGAGGERPLAAEGVEFVSGRHGQALALAPGGRLRYAPAGNLSLEEGTIELWVALRADGDDQAYSRAHHLLHYRAPNGDTLTIAQAKDTGILYAGGSVGGRWQSAYGSGAAMHDWHAGEWHHLAFTYSARQQFMRFYVDGVLRADTNERRYSPPAAGGDLAIGSSLWGEVALYWIDELRLSARVADAAEIAARARRRDPPRPGEVWLSTATLEPGDTVVFEFTPAAAGEQGEPCRSAPLTYPGIPVFDPQPPSTLLPPGARQVTLSVRTITNTTCAYAVGQVLPLEAMTPFDRGSGSTGHRTVIGGLDPDPNGLNHVYVRCAAYPDYLMHLLYRSLSEANPSYPRTGNLWGSRRFMDRGMPYAARIDLWLGAAFTPEQIRQLRQLNPNVRVLTSINAIEHKGLPEDYYLRDVNGNRIEVWPGSYRLNLTKLYVAEYQAQYAYQRILDSGLTFDGCFFDNVMTTQSWLRRDIYGNLVQIDANEDGVPDDPQQLDAAWKAGVFHEIEVFRQLMPYAVVSGHAMDIREPGIAELFNGISIGFWTADVIEGKRSFGDLWDRYQAWLSQAREPQTTMIESSPPDQIAYGYDYSPWKNIPPATLEFARSYYPYVRFGLAFTLLGDGFFAHEFGDTWHGNDWWYDELDFELGYPLGPAEEVEVGAGNGPNIIVNGGFEEPIQPPWQLWANTGAGAQATVSRDTVVAAVGTASARIDVTAISGTDWHISLAQWDRRLKGGAVYQVAFFARADSTRQIRVSAQKGSPDWRNYGLSRAVTIGPQWQEYRLSFEATETTDEARLQFFVGQTTGRVWLDEVQLYERGPEVYWRRFTNGLVILNASRQAQQVEVGPGYARLKGNQAPRQEFIADDSGPGFSTTGQWQAVTYDSGQWQAGGPFYHDWGPGCHESAGAGAQARWELPLAATDTYTITAWWPAAPEASQWTEEAIYEVVAGDKVVATAILDQRRGGDQWHLVAQVRLSSEDQPAVRLRCAGRCVADALHVRSAARYNDGSAAPVVTLGPMDGILLRRLPPPPLYVPFVSAP